MSYGGRDENRKTRKKEEGEKKVQKAGLDANVMIKVYEP
jgi:hypothetical protein